MSDSPAPAAALVGNSNEVPNSNDNMKSESPQQPSPPSVARPRQYWLDWCRTQSVWNVLCGHAWWTIVDLTQSHKTNDYRYDLTDLGDFNTRKYNREVGLEAGSAADVPLYGNYGGYYTIGNTADPGKSQPGGAFSSSSTILDVVKERQWNGKVLYSNVFTSESFNRPFLNGPLSNSGSNRGEVGSNSIALLDGDNIDQNAVLQAREYSNMIEYTVEIGALHTIPLFFLLSGYISALSSGYRGLPISGGVDHLLHVFGDQTTHRYFKAIKVVKDEIQFAASRVSSFGGPKWPTLSSYLLHYAKPMSDIGEMSIITFSIRRVKRLLLPFIFGSLTGVLPRLILKDDDWSPMDLVFSEMYFLYILFAWGVANYTWCQLLHHFKSWYELVVIRSSNNIASQIPEKEKINADSKESSSGDQIMGGSGGADYDISPTSTAPERESALKSKVIMYWVITVIIMWAIPFIAFSIFKDDDYDTKILRPISIGICYLISTMFLMVALKIAEHAGNVTLTTKDYEIDTGSPMNNSNDNSGGMNMNPSDNMNNNNNNLNQPLPGQFNNSNAQDGSPLMTNNTYNNSAVGLKNSLAHNPASHRILIASYFCIVCAVMCFIPVSFLLVADPLKVEDTEFDWLSPNMWIVFLLLQFLYMFGYTFRVFESYLRFFIKVFLYPNFLGVSFILLSFMWPMFTFWAERSLRRVGPWVSFYDDYQRQWGLLRCWGWMALMASLSKVFADGPIHPRIHRHLTASAMVIYIFHRLVEHIWLVEIFGAPDSTVAAKVVDAKTHHYSVDGVIDRGELVWRIVVLNLLTCMGIYAILVQTKVSRMLFGIEEVK